MTRTENEIRQELAAVEAHAELIQRRLDAIIGQRDQLLAELCDTTGAASNRYVGAR